MLDEKTLQALKAKLPHRHTPAIIKAYKAAGHGEVSRSTINRFFNGSAYSEALHSAILNVASLQQQLAAKTTEVLNA